MPRAELLAEKIGLTPETHPEHYTPAYLCPVCDARGFRTNEVCGSCGVRSEGSYGNYEDMLDLPDPLCPGDTADVWLGPLIDHLGAVNFIRYSVDLWGVRIPAPAHADGPTKVTAIVNALLAADPDFREKWETCDA